MQEILNYALQHGTPIIQKPALEFLQKLIVDNNIKSVLEIGTAIGYSAINMALLGCQVSTIEKDFDAYCTAFDNVRRFNLQNNIELIYQDALMFNTNKVYDLLFIDGAKAQSIAFLEQYRHCLKKGSYVIVDNINFHSLTYTNKKLNRDLNQLTRKIRQYVDYIQSDKAFITNIYDIGDGIAVSRMI